MGKKLFYYLTQSMEETLEDELTRIKSKDSRDKFIYQQLRIAVMNGHQFKQQILDDGKINIPMGNQQQTFTISKTELNAEEISADAKYKPFPKARKQVIIIGDILYSELIDTAKVQNILNRKMTDGKAEPINCIEEYFQNLITNTIRGISAKQMQDKLQKEEEEVFKELEQSKEEKADN